MTLQQPLQQPGDRVFRSPRPLALTVVLIVLDQLSKLWIVKNVPLYYSTGYGISVIGDFFRIIHARNLGIAFSIGYHLPDFVRRLLFIALPLIVVLVLLYLLFRTDEFRGLQRWCIAAIVGGGVGNLIDRIFRPTGVVDFLDVKFYGLFGLERWPTFNVADASTVVGGILLITLMIFEKESS